MKVITDNSAMTEGAFNKKKNKTVFNRKLDIN